MFRNSRVEAKVGIFIGMGIFLAFLIVFSISDIYILKDGYDIQVVFDYVNGITENSPVRLAGVHVGEVRGLDIYYDDDVSKTRVRLDVRIKKDIQIERDAVARINTLGLLGEQYLEISPGKDTLFLKAGDSIVGRNPVNVGEQMERMSGLIDAFSEIGEGALSGEGTLGKLLSDDSLYNNIDGVLGGLNSGEGTLGKLLKDDTLYDDLEEILGRLKRGEGTLGKLLVEDKLYDDAEDLVSDVKANPWKLLRKTSSDRKKSDDSDAPREGTKIGPK